jgi:hypothetical protein
MAIPTLIYSSEIWNGSKGPNLDDDDDDSKNRTSAIPKSAI